MEDVKECECGCLGLILIKDKWGRLRRFKRGHWGRGSHLSEETKQKLRIINLRENNKRWKGGKTKDRDGHIRILRSDSSRKGRIYEHRFIYEEYYKCCLLIWTIIHHDNGNPADNRIENLVPMFNPQHTSLEKSVYSPDHRCIECGSIKTYIIKKTGKKRWCRGMCTNCVDRFYRKKRKQSN